MSLTWADLAAAMAKVPPNQWDTPIELVPPTCDGDTPIQLQSLISVGSIRELFHDPENPQTPLQLTRSAFDNAHHPSRYVLLLDRHGYAEDGTSCYTLTAEGEIPSEHGKGHPTGTVIED